MQLAKRLNIALEQSPLSSYIGKTIDCLELKKSLNSIANQFNAKVIIKYDKELCKNVLDHHISGEYVYGRKSRPSTVILHFSPERKTITLTKYLMNKIIFLFSQTIQHEHIHAEQELKKRGTFCKTVKIQYRNKFGKDRIENIEYFSSGDEIAPLAHDLALEICQYYPKISVEEIFKDMKKYRNLRTLNSQVYSFEKTFKNMDWDKLKQTLSKKTSYWLPTVIPVYQIQ